jgi:hypothetical protein
VQTGFPAGCSGSGWARGSNDGKACAPVAGCPSLSSHQIGGPLTGETLCGSVGWPMCFRMRRTVEPWGTKAIIRRSAEQFGQVSGIDSYRRAKSTAQRYRAGERQLAPAAKELNCPADQMGDSAPMSVWLSKKSCARSLLMAVTSRRN